MVVTPPVASPITGVKALEIVGDIPSITAIGEQPIKANDLITATGTLLLAPGTIPGTASAGTAGIGGVTPSLTTGSGNNWPITVEGPYYRDQITLRVGAQPEGLGAPGTTGDATLRLTRDALVPDKSVQYQIPGAVGGGPAPSGGPAPGSGDAAGSEDAAGGGPAPSGDAPGGEPAPGDHGTAEQTGS